MGEGFVKGEPNDLGWDVVPGGLLEKRAEDSGWDEAPADDEVGAEGGEEVGAGGLALQGYVFLTPTQSKLAWVLPLWLRT